MHQSLSDATTDRASGFQMSSPFSLSLFSLAGERSMCMGYLVLSDLRGGRSSIGFVNVLPPFSLHDIITPVVSSH